MKSAMDSRVVLRLLIALCVAGLSGCSPPEPAAAPEPATTRDGDQASEQAALEQRRLQLEKQLLADLRKLRESRQASAGGAEQTSENADSGDCELLVFGGPIREIFLGCLSDESRADSVFNLKGEHGSNLSPLSIRNKFAPYGSNHDDTSACNPRATHPPVVVASSGKSLGLLTVNASLKRRIVAPSVTDWLARMCGT